VFVRITELGEAHYSLCKGAGVFRTKRKGGIEKKGCRGKGLHLKISSSASLRENQLADRGGVRRGGGTQRGRVGVCLGGR